MPRRAADDHAVVFTSGANANDGYLRRILFTQRVLSDEEIAGACF
jgi:hypothetical protein